MAAEFGPGFVRTVFRTLSGNASKQQRAVTLATLSRIVRGTPVDTGVLRRSFTAQETDSAIFVQKPEKGTVLRTPLPTLSAIPITGSGKPLYITTAVLYAIYINEGHSQLAPAKYIEKALLNAVRSVK